MIWIWACEDTLPRSDSLSQVSYVSDQFSPSLEMVPLLPAEACGYLLNASNAWCLLGDHLCFPTKVSDLKFVYRIALLIVSASCRALISLRYPTTPSHVSVVWAHLQIQTCLPSILLALGHASCWTQPKALQVSGREVPMCWRPWDSPGLLSGLQGRQMRHKWRWEHHGPGYQGLLWRWGGCFVQGWEHVRRDSMWPKFTSLAGWHLSGQPKA